MATDNSQNSKGLFNVPIDSLRPGEPSASYVEQYKLYLSYLDKLADRRQSANSFFLTLNTGLCAALAFLLSKDASSDIKHLHFVIPFAGIILSVFWSRLVASYRQLSTGKFEIVHQMEAFMPLAPYRAEWEVLGRGNNSQKYIPLTHVEVWVPRLFIGMYLVLMIFTAPWSRIIALIRCA